VITPFRAKEFVDPGKPPPWWWAKPMPPLWQYFSCLPSKKRQTSPFRPPKGADSGPHGLFPSITALSRGPREGAIIPFLDPELAAVRLEAKGLPPKAMPPLWQYFSRLGKKIPGRGVRNRPPLPAHVPVEGASVRLSGIRRRTGPKHGWSSLPRPFLPRWVRGKIYRKRKPPAAAPRAFHIARGAFVTEGGYSTSPQCLRPGPHEEVRSAGGVT
jgi:hypothetical protein